MCQRYVSLPELLALQPLEELHVPPRFRVNVVQVRDRVHPVSRRVPMPRRHTRLVSNVAADLEAAEIDLATPSL